MIYYLQLYLFLFIASAAYRDGVGHQIRVQAKMPYLAIKRLIHHWHSAGVVMNIIVALPGLLVCKWWQVVVAMLLIRVIFFDLFRNIGAGINVGEFGTEAQSDTIFTNIFGKNGGVKKAIVFFVILIILNVCVLNNP